MNQQKTMMTDGMSSAFMVVHLDDLMVVLVDLDQGGRSVTNDAYNVIKRLDKTVPGGLKKRRVFYQDSDGRFDELIHYQGIFVRFAPCTEAQQKFFADLCLPGI